MGRYKDETNCRHIVERPGTFWNHYNLSSESLLDEELSVFVRNQSSSSELSALNRHSESKFFLSDYSKIH